MVKIATKYKVIAGNSSLANRTVEIDVPIIVCGALLANYSADKAAITFNEGDGSTLSGVVVVPAGDTITYSHNWVADHGLIVKFTPALATVYATIYYRIANI
jgi:hypothetical protein